MLYLAFRSKDLFCFMVGTWHPLNMRMRSSPGIFVNAVYGRRSCDSVVDASRVSGVVRFGRAVVSGVVGVRVGCHGE